jgi:hypothetical protein
MIRPYFSKSLIDTIPYLRQKDKPQKAKNAHFAHCMSWIVPLDRKNPGRNVKCGKNVTFGISGGTWI